jgi:hypothetical protein
LEPWSSRRSWISGGFGFAGCAAGVGFAGFGGH